MTSKKNYNTDEYTYEMLLEISKLGCSEAFRFPVDVEVNGCANYYEVIKTPMDLLQIKEKFREGNYQNVYQILDDINLIISNCRFFNPIDHQIRKVVDKFEQCVQNRWKNLMDTLTKNNFPTELHVNPETLDQIDQRKQKKKDPALQNHPVSEIKKRPVPPPLSQIFQHEQIKSEIKINKKPEKEKIFQEEEEIFKPLQKNIFEQPKPPQSKVEPQEIRMSPLQTQKQQLSIKIPSEIRDIKVEKPMKTEEPKKTLQRIENSDKFEIKKSEPPIEKHQKIIPELKLPQKPDEIIPKVNDHCMKINLNMHQVQKSSIVDKQDQKPKELDSKKPSVGKIPQQFIVKLNKEEIQKAYLERQSQKLAKNKKFIHRVLQQFLQVLQNQKEKISKLQLSFEIKSLGILESCLKTATQNKINFVAESRGLNYIIQMEVLWLTSNFTKLVFQDLQDQLKYCRLVTKSINVMKTARKHLDIQEQQSESKEKVNFTEQMEQFFGQFDQQLAEEIKQFNIPPPPIYKPVSQIISKTGDLQSSPIKSFKTEQPITYTPQKTHHDIQPIFKKPVQVINEEEQQKEKENMFAQFIREYNEKFKYEDQQIDGKRLFKQKKIQKKHKKSMDVPNMIVFSDFSLEIPSFQTAPIQESQIFEEILEEKKCCEQVQFKGLMDINGTSVEEELIGSINETIKNLKQYIQ